MSDRDDWEFAGPDDAKAEIRAAVGYLLRGATGGARGDIVQEIVAIHSSASCSALGQFGDVRGGVTERDQRFSGRARDRIDKPLIQRHEFAFAPNWWGNERIWQGSKHFSKILTSWTRSSCGGRL